MGFYNHDRHYWQPTQEDHSEVWKKIITCSSCLKEFLYFIYNSFKIFWPISFCLPPKSPEHRNVQRAFNFLEERHQKSTVSKNKNLHFTFFFCFGFTAFIEPITSILMKIIIHLTSQQKENEILFDPLLIHSR